MTLVSLLLNPAVLRIVIAAALSAAIFMWGYGCGESAVQEKWDAYSREAAEELSRVEAANKASTSKLVEAHLKELAEISSKTITITKKVPVYVPSNSCPMPAGFRVLHDEAAAGTFPGASGNLDGSSRAP